MTHFYHLLTDEESDRELVECMKRREVNNKFFYFGEGAQTYYDIFNVIHGPKGGYQDITKGEQEQESIDESGMEWMAQSIPQNAAVISLGCGRCSMEATLLKERPDLKFIGVDSSHAMLELAKVEIEKQVGPDNNHYLVCADISHTRFIDTIDRLCEDMGAQQRAFLFVDLTIGNIKQTEIMDTLYNVMKPADKLLFDAAKRERIDALTDAETALSYETPERIAIEEQRTNVVLQRFGWSAPRDGNIIIQIWEERECGALTINFAFRANKLLQGTFRGQTVHLLENEHIRMLSVRRFHLETYTRFLENYGFVISSALSTVKRHRIIATKK